MSREPRLRDGDGRGEAGRRAGVIRRYVGIVQPTEGDDERFANELGVSRDTLYRLAAAWRRHPDEASLQGSRIRTGAAERQAALAAAVSPDLRGVDPSRRPEISRRIGIVRNLLEIACPSREDVKAAAVAMGMHESAFRRLLRIWLLHRDAASLPGAKRPMRIPHRRARTVPVEVERIVTRTMREAGPDVSSVGLHRMVDARCRELGLKAPSQSTLYHRLMAMRADTVDDVDPVLVVDHCALALAVEVEGEVQLPVLGMVFERPSGRIMVHSLSYGPPTARAAAMLLIDAVERDHATRWPRLALDMGFGAGDEWADLRSFLEAAGVDLTDRGRPLRAGRAIGRTMGDVVGNLRFRPRSTLNPDAPLTGRLIRAGSVLRPVEAAAVVDDAVALHNADRPGSGGFVTAANLPGLVTSLRDAIAATSTDQPS